MKIKRNAPKRGVLFLLFCLFMMGTGVIFYFSSQPPGVSNSQSGKAVKIIQAVNDAFDITDTNLYAKIESKVKNIGFISRYKTPNAVVRKSAHFGIYFLMGMISACFGYFYARKILIGFLLGISLPVTIAVLDEYNQSFVGRGDSLNDVIIDGAGAFAGSLTVVILILIFKVIKLCLANIKRMF
ncbi:MAG TPA: VanZ family protein [Clostridia bacterium]|jgi:VanZ family protein|nr:VanZ family protein [Clostridia bacterium]